MLVCHLGVLVVSLMLIGDSNASQKKGVALSNWGNHHCGDEFALTHIHWWYDWKQREEIDLLRNKCTGAHRAGYVPMIAGRKPMHFPINITSTDKYVLGYNEPDHAKHANLTPADAAHYWKTEIEPNAQGKILVSPAVTNLNWLTEFFHHCVGCRVDHVAIHKYSCSATRIMNALNEAHRRFNRPIWLTEFSCPHTHDTNQQLNLMKQLLPQLESAPYVFRYSWFATRVMKDAWVTTAVRLLNDDASLTTIGHYYNNFNA